MKNKFFIAIGSNIKSPKGIEPIKNCNNAIKELTKFNINLVKRSSWYMSEPIPKSSQPKFYNLVLLCTANYNAIKILKIIQIVEKKFGRIRIFDNMPRCIDIDIISFNKNVKKSLLLTLPHPRMHLRQFVLSPLLEIDSSWSHPLFKKRIKFFMKKLKGQKIKKIKTV